MGLGVRAQKEGIVACGRAWCGFDARWVVGCIPVNHSRIFRILARGTCQGDEEKSSHMHDLDGANLKLQERFAFAGPDQ
jgi:hypothetical protein